MYRIQQQIVISILYKNEGSLHGHIKIMTKDIINILSCITQQVFTPFVCLYAMQLTLFMIVFISKEKLIYFHGMQL